MKTHERALQTDDIDGAKRRFDELRQAEFPAFLALELTETDTRSKIIDAILRDVLHWPEGLIKREPHVQGTGGYVDYLLSTSHPYFVVEAKRASHRYKLPLHRTRSQYKVGGVLSEDKILVDDMVQARAYAIGNGVGFCCLTNGQQYLFFRSQNDSGIPWTDHVVVVFRDLEEVSQRFSEFFHLFSYASVSQGIVHGRLPITEHYDEALRRYQKLNPKKQMLARTRERNSLFPCLKSIISRVFQDISGEASSSEILENCYVESARDSSYEKGLDNLLRRRPIDMGHGARPVTVTKKDAGEFQRTIEQQMTKPLGDPEVVLILGGVGVGKTTFIDRFRKVIAADDIAENSLWAYVDFNKYSDTGETLLAWVVKALWQSLELNFPELELQSYAALKQAYHAEYEQLKKGRLAPLYARDPAEFELSFAHELKNYEKAADEHLVRLLRVAAKRTERRPFLVFDNADQFSEQTQDQVFRLAQKFAQEVGCASVISLREESYWRNKEHGTLSAFHAVSYQVQAPRLRSVISKRLKFAIKLLGESEKDFIDSDGRPVTASELLGIMENLSQMLLGEDERYIDLLERLSPFEIRRPLEFLARFLASGHTNMDSLLTRQRRHRPDITIGFHEFFGSIALGDHEVYSEASSDILNMFAVDGRADASNLNRLIVVGRVLKSKTNSTPFGVGFVPVAELVNDSETLGVSPDTSRSILALFNSKRLVETEAQGRDELGSATFVRATAAAQYYIDTLIYDFSYLDTIVIDTAVGDSEAYEDLKVLTDQLEDLQTRKGQVRLQRIRIRVERAKRLLKYLSKEFAKSSLGEHLQIVDPAIAKYFQSAEGTLLRQGHAVEENARRVFGG